ncbi:MAG: DinI family protein [Mesorhizobium sp.]|nr:MAG: DinI family protein [Mesorhizobium sp.]
MIHIEVVIGEDTKYAERILEALRVQLSERLSEFAPAIRVKTGAVSSLSLWGVKDSSERETVMTMIQSVWEDDSWIPDEVSHDS